MERLGLFVMRGDEIVLKVVKGTVLDLRGSVQPSARPEDFEKIRRSVRQAVAKKESRKGPNVVGN